MKKSGIELIAEERHEQIEKHGWDHDLEYEGKELVQAAIFCLTLKEDDYPEWWHCWFYDKVKAKRERMNKIEFEIEMLKIAGALIAAEIDRIQALE